jgi:hypothetical protein
MIFSASRRPVARLPSLRSGGARVALLLAVTAVACGPSQPAQTSGATNATSDTKTTTTAPSAPAQIVSFALGQDSLQFDKVGMRDGELNPDGAKDLSFDAVVVGPITQLFVFQTDAKCAVSGSFRSDTLVGSQEAPQELGGTLELGRLALGMGVQENGKFINKETGAIPLLTPERHTLRLYIGNTNALQPRTHACLFALQPDGVLVRSAPLSF